MDTMLIEDTQSLMLDGNALAGLLYELFNAQMTIAPVKCADCGQVGEIGGLWAFIASPGYVLCCPAC